MIYVTVFLPLQQDRGPPLPKFGEWDVNNPASAEGFTMIFNKARDEKKTAVNMVNKRKSERVNKNESNSEYPGKVKPI